jgi:hypothetical protein
MISRPGVSGSSLRSRKAAIQQDLADVIEGLLTLLG